MSSSFAPTTKMPTIGDRPLSGKRLSRKSSRGGWKAFRRSVHGAVRSVGAWFLAVCVGAFTVSLSWMGWIMSNVSQAAFTSAEVGGRGIQQSLPEEDSSSLWVWLAQIHPAWFIAAPAAIFFGVIVFKEVK